MHFNYSPVNPLQPKIGGDFDAYTIFALYKYKKQGGYTALLWS